MRSITSSPIRHAILAGNKNNRFKIEQKKGLLTEAEKMGQLYGDRTQIDNEERKYEIHNADG